jgi:hypothetical protein
MLIDDTIIFLGDDRIGKVLASYLYCIFCKGAYAVIGLKVLLRDLLRIGHVSFGLAFEIFYSSS